MPAVRPEPTQLARPRPAPILTAVPIPRPRRPGWSSLDRKLPLLIVALLVPTVALFALWSYREVRQDLLLAAEARMTGGAQALQGLLADMIAMRIRDVDATAARPEVVACLRTPDQAGIERARAVLEEPTRVSAQRTVIELWDLGGKCVLQATRGGTGAVEPLLADAPAPKVKGAQAFRAAGTLLLFEVVAEVHEPSPAASAAASPGASPAPPPAPGPLLGYVVHRRSLGGSTRTAIAMLGKLIGNEATWLVGNSDGSVWTDLEKVTHPPPVDPLAAGDRVHFARDGSMRVGSGARIGDSPWVVWVESDASHALAPANTLLPRMLLVTLGLLLLGAGASWWVSRRITRPLREVTVAAEAIAIGQYQHRLALRRHDEVGRLAEAFDTMAERVDDARRELEDRVAKRTVELREALDRLRETQDELVRSERLAILGQLAGGVGHELRNPLAVMSNAIFYLEMILQSPGAEVREYLGILRNQIGLSETIISSLLDFARSRAPCLQTIRLAALVEEQLTRLEGLSITVVRDFPESLPAVRVDPVQIGQVVFNLLTNAVQAIGGNPGTLTLRGRTQGPRVTLAVTDSGRGVPRELAEKIFEPLFTTRPRGIGLGLAISRRLAQANGGELELETPRPGEGATFVLSLPAATEEPS